nr:putative capsid [Marmot picobirnavirus]
MKGKQTQSKRKQNTKGRQRMNNGSGRRDYQNTSREAYRKEALAAEATEHKYNDVSWYAKNQQMLSDAASFSYNSPLGNRIPWERVAALPQDATGIANWIKAPEVPGLMLFKFEPGIGISKNSSSPANLAAQNIYTYVRYMNSGSKNYDQADLMLYLLAMDSIYMVWNWMKRVYGYASLYSQYNKYLPRVFAQADNVDLDDVIANMADFRYHINSLAAQISSFCVPAVMPLFVRHSWMVSNLYKDSNLLKSQMYMMSPNTYYVYSETGSPYGGYLQAKGFPNPTSGMKITDMVAVMKDMLNKVAYSEDIGVMSGDILKAYGQERLFKISPVEENYTVEPVYNEEVLNQLHNSRMVSMSRTNITQDPDTGFLIYDPVTTEKAVAVTDATFVNMPWDSVTPANTMVGTRLTPVLSRVDANTVKVQAAGSEIISRRSILYYDFDQSSAGVIQKRELPSALYMLQDVTSEMVSMISNFDWHPLFPMWWKTGSGDTTTYVFKGMLGDISNYTIIDNYSMEQMHTTAILSEFNVPQLGSF